MIPYGRQEITEADIAEVEKVLRSDFLTQGPTVPRFEKSVANYAKEVRDRSFPSDEQVYR